MPKSATFTWPLGEMSTLPGFTSRCTTPLRCANPSAAAMSDATSAARCGCSGPFGPQDVGQAAALDVLHHDEVRALLLAPVVDRHDVRVVQVGGALRLTAEPLDEARIGGELREQHLDGDGAVEQLIAGEEDVGHAAARDAAVQLVATVEHRFLGHGRVEAY